MRARRVDANLDTVVDAYRKSGIRVWVLNDDLCDLVTQFGGVTDLVEVKDGRKPPSARKLTPHQVKTHESMMIRMVIGIEQAKDHAKILKNKWYAICAKGSNVLEQQK
jgi:hypothetical protein